MTTPSDRVATDAAFRAALVAARSWGARPTEFLGLPVVSVHELDPAGRVVRVERAGWSDDDRELAMALAVFEADACPGCGGQIAETTSPENEERYEAKIQAKCHRCYALAIVQAQAEKLPNPGSLLIGATLKTQGDVNHDSEIPA